MEMVRLIQTSYHSHFAGCLGVPGQTFAIAAKTLATLGPGRHALGSQPASLHPETGDRTRKDDCLVLPEFHQQFALQSVKTMGKGLGILKSSIPKGDVFRKGTGHNGAELLDIEEIVAENEQVPERGKPSATWSKRTGHVG
jgi:hypothetical protein